MERNEARRLRDFDAADGIRDQLRSEFNVELFDRDFQWQVGRRNTGYASGGGRGSFGGYERAAGDAAEVDVAAVERLIEDRDTARRNRDFNSADGIRDQLRNEFNVELFDRDFQWQVGVRSRGYGDGGNSYDGGGYSERPPPRGYDASNFGPSGHDYERAYDNVDVQMPDDTLVVVDELLASRLAAKMVRDFDKADALKDQLQGLGVSVQDKRKTWAYTAPKDYGPLGHDYERADDCAADLDDAAIARINELLATRLQVRAPPEVTTHLSARKPCHACALARFAGQAAPPV